MCCIIIDVWLLAMFLRGEHTTSTCYHVNVDMSLDKAKTILVAQHLLVQQYLSFTNSHYSLDQPTACSGWVGGGYWVNIWGKWMRREPTTEL